LLTNFSHVEREESVGIEDLVGVPFQGVDGGVLGSPELALNVEVCAV
jgi:hypothetical protein